MMKRGKFNIILAGIVMLVSVVLPYSSSAQSKSERELIEEQQRKIAQLEAQIEKGEQALSTIKKDKASTNKRMESISRQISDREALINQTERQMSRLKSDMSKKQQQVDSINTLLTQERALYAEMVREAYRNYKQNNYTLYLLSSKDFEQGARRIANIRAVAELRSKRMARIDSLQQQLNAEQAELNHRKELLDDTYNKTVKHRNSLKLDVKTAQKEIQRLTAQERTKLKENLEAQESLDDAIAELRKLTKGNTTGATFKPKKSNLKLPLDNATVRQYKGNMAEIVGVKGSRVRSIYDGKVIDIRQNKVTGKWDVYVAHGEYITSYSNLEEVSVATNDVVVSNQPLGRVGAGINIKTAEIEYKIIFGIYSPNPKEKLSAAECFKRK